MKPLRIGHRGAAGHAPENTLLSIETALSLGVDVVEVDVHASRDGHLIVMHDDRVDRLTNGSGYIRDLTLAELRSVETKSAQAIPTLSDIVRAVSGRAALMVDIKARGIIPDVIAAVALAPQMPVFYASFFHAELLEVRRLQPAANTIALIEAVPVSHTAFAIEAAANYAGVALDSLVPEFVASLKAARLGIFAYTVDAVADITYAQSLSIDGLISNYPDRLA